MTGTDKSLADILFKASKTSKKSSVCLTQCYFAENKTADTHKMADNELTVFDKMSQSKLADPYKMSCPGFEDIDILSTLIPGFDFAVSASPSKSSIADMGNEPDDFLKYLLSSSS